MLETGLLVRWWLLPHGLIPLLHILHQRSYTKLRPITRRSIDLQPWTQVIFIIRIHIRTRSLRHYNRRRIPCRIPIFIHAPYHTARTLRASIAARSKRQARRSVEVPPIVRVRVVPVVVVTIRIGDAMQGATDIDIVEELGDASHLVWDVVEAIPVVEADLQAVAIVEFLLQKWAVAIAFGGVLVGLLKDPCTEGVDLGLPGNNSCGGCGRWRCYCCDLKQGVAYFQQNGSKKRLARCRHRRGYLLF